jgi:hypothetical protein
VLRGIFCGIILVCVEACGVSFVCAQMNEAVTLSCFLYRNKFTKNASSALGKSGFEPGTVTLLVHETSLYYFFSVSFFI